MQVIQCKRVSETQTAVQGKKSVSIDFYDFETAFMIKRVLDTLCNGEYVGLTAYGRNLYHIDFEIDQDDWDIMNRVCKGLCKICTRVAPDSATYISDIMKPCAMFE